jgi:hypothetical protein
MTKVISRAVNAKQEAILARPSSKAYMHWDWPAAERAAGGR